MLGVCCFFFFFNEAAPPEFSPLPLHAAFLIKNEKDKIFWAERYAGGTAAESESMLRKWQRGLVAIV